MALIIENGTGLANAESLCSVEYANAFHKAMGNEAWSNYSTPQKEVFLRRATMYLRHAYSHAWKGERVKAEQKLDWPRIHADAHGFRIHPDTIPQEPIDATAILALKAADGPLMPDLERAVLREKVGTLEVEYDRASPQARRYAEIDALLAPLLQGVRGVSVQMVRT